MHSIGRIATALALTCLLPAGAMADPDYIEASTKGLAKAYGEEVAERALSDEMTQARTELIKESLSPGEGCPDDPDFSLTAMVPYKVDGDVMWIERYTVDCQTELHRTILMILKDGEIQAVPMAPGTTIADPQLQIDAANFVKTAAMTRTAGKCAEATVTDTAVASPPEKLGLPWKESWTAQACGKAYTFPVSFTPSAGGGTDISVVASE